MSGQPSLSDSRFLAVIESLAARRHPRPLHAQERDGRREAAVALVLRAGASLELLLIKRARSARDPWSGHIALPGGRKEDDDADLQATASRETREETSVDLVRYGTSLGRLDGVITGHRRLPRLSISPFVFGVPADVSAHAASPEVERVHWIPVDELRSPRRHGRVEIPLPDGPTDVPCIRVADDVLWGLTYRIVQQFLDVFSVPPTSLGP